MKQKLWPPYRAGTMFRPDGINLRTPHTWDAYSFLVVTLNRKILIRKPGHWPSSTRTSRLLSLGWRP